MSPTGIATRTGIFLGHNGGHDARSWNSWCSFRGVVIHRSLSGVAALLLQRWSHQLRLSGFHRNDRDRGAIELQIQSAGELRYAIATAPTAKTVKFHPEQRKSS